MRLATAAAQQKGVKRSNKKSLFYSSQELPTRNPSSRRVQKSGADFFPPSSPLSLAFLVMGSPEPPPPPPTSVLGHLLVLSGREGFFSPPRFGWVDWGREGEGSSSIKTRMLCVSCFLSFSLPLPFSLVAAKRRWGRKLGQPDIRSDI